MKPRTIDGRMESFVASCGVVPAEAHRLEDFEARRHAATWIQRLIGTGIACHQVIGYALGQSWWTFCFDRHAELETDEENEVWRVEAYDSIGRGWRDTFTYSLDTGQWRRYVPVSQGASNHFASGSGRS
jgi:hypothetical protein